MREGIAAAELGQGTNLALMYYRCLPNEVLGGATKQGFLKQIAMRTPGPAYAQAFESYRASLESLGQECVVFEAEARSPIVYGLAEKGVLENGLRFARPFGVPRIDGSALKGGMRRELARRLGLRDSLAELQVDGKGETFAPNKGLEDLRRSVAPELHPQLEAWMAAFGAPDQVGAFDIFDAWLIPSNEPPLMLDVVTVHHPKYYKGEDPVPNDWDEPIPIAFLSVRPLTKFLFSFRAMPDWQPLVKEVLAAVLEKRGVGGKTNAGYGRFRCL